MRYCRLANQFAAGQEETGRLRVAVESVSKDPDPLTIFDEGGIEVIKYIEVISTQFLSKVSSIFCRLKSQASDERAHDAIRVSRALQVHVMYALRCPLQLAYFARRFLRQFTLANATQPC